MILTVNPPIYAIGEKTPEKKKKVKALPVFEPVTSANTGALLYQLSYEATHWDPGHGWKFLFKSQFASALSLL